MNLICENCNNIFEYEFNSFSYLNSDLETIGVCTQCYNHINSKLKLQYDSSKIKLIKKKAFLLMQKKKVDKSNYFFLSKNGSLKEAARNLYDTLRKISKNNYKSIAVGKIPNKGLGKTINDRLKRASKF